MSHKTPRVAFFTDSFHEVNGVALTSRQFDGFARRRRLPFLSVHAGDGHTCEPHDTVTTCELPRGRMSFGLDTDLRFDLLLPRHRGLVRAALESFRPDLIHVTSPGDLGIMGALLAWEMRIPLAISWHTNIHEFGARRLERKLGFLPESWRRRIGALAEEGILECTVRFYRLGRVLFAPNPELVELLRKGTGKPAFLMQRGVDTTLFSARKRDRTDDAVTLGYVGRLSTEKNVRLLAEVERAMEAAGLRNYRFLIVGQGSERKWLSDNLRHAEFTGVLKGEALARAYANMDVFLFPSHTDTFGNVVLEATASGVPVVATTSGGPKFLISSGVNGVTAASDDAFVRAAVELASAPARIEGMRQAAREMASAASWDRVFELTYAAYSACLAGRDESWEGDKSPSEWLAMKV